MCAAGLELVRHGGDLDAARARLPGAPEPWIDLSTGVNPIAYQLPHMLPETWTRLPQGAQMQRLLAAAAARYGAPAADMIAAAPGTQALIQLLPRLVARCHVAIVGPTYDEHALCWRRLGHDVAMVESLVAARTLAAQVIVVVNPNNPTGRLHSRAELNAAAANVARAGGLLVVDEAFVDVLPADASVIADLPPSTVVLRSFGKTYGLAGVRLGFAVASADVVERIRAELGPWAVSGPAIEIGIRALRDETWLTIATGRLNIDANRLDRMLQSAGCTMIGGTPLFRLAEHPEASRLAGRLGRAGIHVRTFAQSPKWLRFGLPGSEPEWQRLHQALGTVRS